MSRDNIKVNFEKEHIYTFEVDVPRCVNTYGSSPCTAEQYKTTLLVESGNFVVGDVIVGSTSGNSVTITRISRSGRRLIIGYTLDIAASNLDNSAELLTNQTRPGSATKDANAPVDDKCYNTRSTCQDLANYNQNFETGAATIDVNATNRTFTRSSGSYITDGFEVGHIITTTGFTDDGNNSQFEIESVTATVITVTNNYGLATESGTGDEEITAPNLYTYYNCESRSPHPQNMNNYAPCVKNVSIAPATIDPKGGIGARTSVTVSLEDFPSSDRYDIDPYLSDRDFEPLDVGLHWLKWRTRNANYENYNARIKSGYIVDNTYDEDNFETRYYVVSSMTASNGQAGFRLKDPLQLVSNKKALAPAPSNGTIDADINAAATSFDVEPAGIGNDEYPSSGYIKIRNEVMSFTRASDTFTVVRGQFNTTATPHELGDTVQLCLNYDGTQTLDEVLRDLLVNYGKVPAFYIPGGAWSAEVSDYLSSNPNRLITDPEKLDDLIKGLCTEWPCKLFWNDRSNEIELVALKPPPATNNVLTGADNILELSSVDKPDMQLSTVFVAYGKYDPTKKKDEKDNYQVTAVRANTDAIARYDSNNSKTIQAEWITASNGAAARRLTQLWGRRFGITPRSISFKLEDKDSGAGGVWLGDIRFINHHDIVDSNGQQADTAFEILQAGEGDVFDYRALEFNYDKFISGVDDDLTLDNVDLSIDEQNVNLRTRFESIYGTPTASTVVKFTVFSNVTIGSSSTSNPSIETGSWPAGATVTLQINSNAYVVGAGGDGSDDSAVAGSAGGDAISLAYDLELINNGTLGGGGGGGGASSADGHTAGGGGGAGNDAGVAGLNDATGSGTVTNNVPASNGTTENGGTRGRIAYTVAGEPRFVVGAPGSDLGTAGSSGDSAGGAAGKAVDLNGNTLTQTVSGDIRGAVS